MKHFLKETDFTLSEQKELFALCQNYKKNRISNTNHDLPLNGQSWGMLFYKNSTRTRLSFEVGIRELGGHPIFLDPNSMQLGRGETIYDTAKILSRYLHGVIIRTFEHERIVDFAQASNIPVINALTDFLHPCQIYSDAFTLAERWCSDGDLLASLKGRKIAFLGDTASNIAHSWILGAAVLGMKISLAGPDGFQPSPIVDKIIEEAGLKKAYHYTTDPLEAVSNADVVYTDVWVSMGDEKEKKVRIEKMEPYRVSMNIMDQALPQAYFMHCLPVHSGMEVSQSVLDSKQAIIFEQAENRLHMQKAILKLLSDRLL